MPNIKPEFLSLAICETVIEDKRTGNKSVINIFDQISVPRFPYLFPRLTVFAALSGLHGDVQLRVRLVRLEDDRDVVSGEGMVHATADPLRVVDLVFALQNVPLEKAGAYAVELYGAGELLARRRFQVVQRS